MPSRSSGSPKSPCRGATTSQPRSSPNATARPAPQVSKNMFSLPPAPWSRKRTGSGPSWPAGARRRTGTSALPSERVSQQSPPRASRAMVRPAAPGSATSRSAKASSRAAGKSVSCPREAARSSRSRAIAATVARAVGSEIPSGASRGRRSAARRPSRPATRERPRRATATDPPSPCHSTTSRWSPSGKGPVVQSNDPVASAHGPSRSAMGRPRASSIASLIRAVASSASGAS